MTTSSGVNADPARFRARPPQPKASITQSAIFRRRVGGGQPSFQRGDFVERVTRRSPVDAGLMLVMRPKTSLIASAPVTPQDTAGTSFLPAPELWHAAALGDVAVEREGTPAPLELHRGP